MHKLVIVPLLLVLTATLGCGGVSGVVDKGQQALVDTVEEVKPLMDDSVAKAVEATGKEVAEVVLPEVKETLEELRENAMEDLNKEVNHQREELQSYTTIELDKLKELLQSERKAAITQAVTETKVAMIEVMDTFVKRLGGSTDGTETWVLGGGGLLGLLASAGAWFRTYMNSKSGKKRWSGEELDAEIERRVAIQITKHLERREYVHRNDPSPGFVPPGSSDDRPNPTSWELSL